MKGLIPFLFVIAVLGGGAAYLFTNLAADLDKAQLDGKLAEQRAKAAEQIAHTLSVPDDKVKFDRAQLMRWHKVAIKKALDEHPKIGSEERFIEEMEAKAKEGKKDKAKTAKFRERYDWLKGVYDQTVSKGDYDTVLTMAKGGLRYDVIGITPWVPPEGGKEALRMDILIWGGVKDQVTFANMEFQFLREVEVEERGKKKKKTGIAKIEGGGPPDILHPAGPNPEPSEWIPAWPPSVMVGYYGRLPKLPHDATKVNIKFNLQKRSYGGTTEAVDFEWKNVDVRPEWKASPDDPMWRDAPVGEASDEELKEAGLAVE
jgi:hypothetical protein